MQFAPVECGVHQADPLCSHLIFKTDLPMAKAAMIFHFDLNKTIQASAILLKSDPALQLSRMRLLKLLYIADRESLQERAIPITGDVAFAMDHGPVLSTTYNLIKGEDYGSLDWGRYFENRGRDIVLRTDPGVGDLTRWEIHKLGEISDRYVHADDWNIAEITHQFPEWKDHQPAQGSSTCIPIDDLLKATGNLEQKEKIAADADAEFAARRIFGGK